MARYPEESRHAFGQKHGCFETPREDKPPTNNIDCPDIRPLIYSEEECNGSAMKDMDPLVHPDSSRKTRYCLGTRLQMRKDGKGSHKTLACTYHDLNNAQQGKMLKSMTQEAMQVCRKFRTIQQVGYISQRFNGFQWYTQK